MISFSYEPTYAIRMPVVTRIQKRWPWRVIFAWLIAITCLSVVAPLALYGYLSFNPRTGSEYVFLAIAPLVLMGILVAVINVVLTMYYLIRVAPTKRAIRRGMPFILLSLVYLLLMLSAGI